MPKMFIWKPDVPFAVSIRKQSLDEEIEYCKG